MEREINFDNSSDESEQEETTPLQEILIEQANGNGIIDILELPRNTRKNRSNTITIVKPKKNQESTNTQKPLVSSSWWIRTSREFSNQNMCGSLTEALQLFEGTAKKLAIGESKVLLLLGNEQIDSVYLSALAVFTKASETEKGIIQDFISVVKHLREYFHKRKEEYLKDIVTAWSPVNTINPLLKEFQEKANEFQLCLKNKNSTEAWKLYSVLVQAVRKVRRLVISWTKLDKTDVPPEKLKAPNEIVDKMQVQLQELYLQLQELDKGVEIVQLPVEKKNDQKLVKWLDIYQKNLYICTEFLKDAEKTASDIRSMCGQIDDDSLVETNLLALSMQIQVVVKSRDECKQLTGSMNGNGGALLGQRRNDIKGNDVEFFLGICNRSLGVNMQIANVVTSVMRIVKKTLESLLQRDKYNQKAKLLLIEVNDLLKE